MINCKGCNIVGNFSPTEIRGTDKPSVYIVMDLPSQYDKYPMTGVYGDYLFKLLASCSLVDKIRVSNICRCSTNDHDAVKRCSCNTIFDILMTNPKVIVGVGNIVSEILEVPGFTDISVDHGNIFDLSLNGVTYKYVPIYSPADAANNIDLQSNYVNDIIKISQLATGNYHDVLESKNIMSAYSFEEFETISNEFFVNSKYSSYDIETNAAPILSVDSKIVGFSIADLSSNGVYVCLESLDREMTDLEKNKCLEYLRDYLEEKSRRIIVHNSLYERPYTLGVLDYEIPFDKLDDTLVMARLMLGGHVGAGLKYQAQTNLGYPDWDSDLSNYMSYVKTMFSTLPVEREELRDKSFYDILTEVSLLDKKPKKYKEYEKSVKSLVNLLLKYYDKSEVLSLISKLSTTLYENYIFAGLPEVLPYSLVPSKLISKYGAVDALATSDLYLYYINKMKEESTDEVNLYKGYELWLKHMYAGYIMTRNGAYMDDDLVSRDYRNMSNTATDSLKNMLRSPMMEGILVSQTYDSYLPRILSDYYPEIAESQGYKVEYDRSTGKYSVMSNVLGKWKRVAKANISKIEIDERNYNLISKLVLEFTHSEIDRATNYEDLKFIYNPGSSTQKNVAEYALFGDDLNCCKVIKSLHDHKVHNGTENLSESEKSLVELAYLIVDEKSIKETYEGEELYSVRKTLYNIFKVRLEMEKSVSKNKKLLKIYNEVYNNPDFADEGIIEIYNLYKLMGNNPDDDSTWTEKFRWMVNFRFFKKTTKVITSYIEGTVGRASAMIVDKEELSSGKIRVLRKRPYYNDFVEGPVSNECSLVCIGWGVNTAKSGRWRGAFQTVPFGSRVKEYYVSRFRGGTIFQPDYSQNEVRALAGSANCTKMIEAFKNGLDIHRTNAANIFNKGYDEVTTAERRFAKMSTFGILYGMSNKSFADNYLDGDIAKAEEIMNGFYSAYPDIRDWIDSKHAEVERTGKVGLLTNRFIKIDEPNYGARMRKAQNFPIQGASSDIVGAVIFEICKYIEDNNFKSKLFSFVHDSIEADIYPYELIQMIVEVRKLLINVPIDQFNIPVKADLSLGKSFGHELELKDIETNENYTECVMTLECNKRHFMETFENWKLAYSVVEILEEEWEDSYTSIEELFILKKAYSPEIGTNNPVGKVKVHIKY